MPGRNVQRPTKRLMRDPGNDPTGDRVARYYKPCGARSDRGSLDQGLSRHEAPTRKRVRNKTPSSTRREDEGPGRGSRSGCPRRILHTVSAVGVEADVSPIGEGGGGEVTKAKAGKYGPSKIHTPLRQSVSRPT